MLKYVIIPFIGAFIGYITNLIAVKMLFIPRKKINIFGIAVQGLFPKRKEELAHAVGEVVEKELLNSGDINRVFREANLDNKISELVENSFSDMKFNINIPIVGDISFLLRNKIREFLRESLVTNSPIISQQLGIMVDENLKIKELVTEKIINLESEKLEELILNVAGKELRYITYFGGIIGFIIGILQVIVIIL